MKPAPFRYVRPGTLAEAYAELAEDADARLIAGGQTLVPMLAMRLARPTLLVDIARLPELQGIERRDDTVVVKSATRQVTAEHSDVIKRHVPLLSAALPWVGHPPTRNRGTVGGSCANADPAAEIPLVAVTLDATFEVCDQGEKLEMSSEEFFIAPMITALPPGAILTAVRFPIWDAPRLGVSFLEISSRRSDFALASAACQLTVAEDGRCSAIAMGVGGVGDRPQKLDLSSLIDSNLSSTDIKDAVCAAVASLEATSDLHASADYRLRAAATLGCQVIAAAVMQAKRHEARQ